MILLRTDTPQPRARWRRSAALAALGWRDTILYALYRLLPRLPGRLSLHSYVLYAQPVATVQRLPEGGGALEVRALGPGDPALPELGVDGVAERHRFAQGARCLAVFLRGRAVGCAWFTLGSFQEDEVRCRFVPHPPGLAAWDLGIHVLPAWRGGRAFAKLWDAVDLELRRAGVAWSMSRISVFNPASRRAHERAGAIEVGRLHGLRIGPLQMLIRERPWRISLTIRHVPTVPVPAPQQISNGGGWSDPNRRAR